MIRRRFLSTAMLMGLLWATLPLSRPARAEEPGDALDLIPEDAWGFVMIRSLEAIDRKAAQLKESLQLPIPVPLTPLALQTLQLGEGVNLKSPVCLVLMDVNKFGGQIWSAFALAIPARDPKALLKNLGGEEATDDVAKCRVMGEETFGSVRSGYLILGKSEDCVRKIAKAKKTLRKSFGEARQGALNRSDFYASISVGAVVGNYRQQIEAFTPMLTAGAGMPEKSIQQLIKLFSEIAAFDISLGIDREAFTLRFLTTPKKESDLESFLKDTKNSSESLVALLPREKYLGAFAGLGGYSEHAAKFGQENWVSSLLTQLQLPGVNIKAAEAIDAELIKLGKAVSRWAFSISFLPGGSQGLFGLTAAVETSSPGEFLEGIRNLYKTMWTVSDDEDIETFKEQIVHTADAETIAGNKVDTIKVNLEALAQELDTDEDDVKVAQAVLGKEFVIRFGSVGKTHFICAFGGGKDRFERICEVVDAGKGKSLRDEEGIKSLSPKLASPRSGEGYIAVDNILHAVKAILKIMGEEDEMPFEVPAISAPLAVGSAQVGSVQRVDFIVPMKLATGVKKLVDEQMKREMEAFDEEDEEEGEGEGESEEEKDED